MAKKQDVTSAVTRGARGVRRLSKSVPGQPGMPMLSPGPVEGKRGVRRLIKNDPSDGLTQPEANSMTDTHTDVGRSRVVRVLSQSNAFGSATGAGKRSVKAAGSGPLKRR